MLINTVEHYNTQFMCITVTVEHYHKLLSISMEHYHSFLEVELFSDKCSLLLNNPISKNIYIIQHGKYHIAGSIGRN